MIEAGARRREIEDVASELFHASGYAATSVRDIAKALDIQGASLYAHVASKEDVLWAIVDRRGRRRSRPRPAAAEADTTHGDPVERLAALVEAHVGVVTVGPGAASVFVDRVAPPLGGPPRRDRSSAATPTNDASATAIDEGIAVGAFRRRTRPSPPTFILTALNGIADLVPAGRPPVAPTRSPTTTPTSRSRSLTEDHR